VDPGRVTIRRLNRAEYNNTIRDLVGVSFRPADDFPSDDVGGGFDNIADVLTLPPLLMEKYLAAAERIAEEAIVADPSILRKSQFKFRDQIRGSGSAYYDTAQNARRWTLAGEGSVFADYQFERPGRYTLRVIARGRRAIEQVPKMEMRLDDQKVEVFDVTASDMRGRYETTFRVSDTGIHRLSVVLANRPEVLDDDADTRAPLILVDSMEVDGPLDPAAEDYPAIHQKLVRFRPDESRTAADAAEANLKLLLRRAFRRPVDDTEVAPFAALVTSAVENGDTFEQGMQDALIGVLVSPHFLFRIESPPKSAATGAIYPLDDHAIAARLSYFLWSSMPDEELFQLADAGKLRDAAVVEQQVRRMLVDLKGEALVQNFVAQWLNLRLLDGVAPDPQVFPQFDDELKKAMRRETELFALAVIRENRSVLDFLSGRYSFVNERLAKHYGLSGVTGDEFQKVSFADNRRTGVLTQASILTLTSNPGRTSPVKRGKWMLENILGSPPPEPPPDVPDLESVQKAKPDATLREQLLIHRENPVCASCHKVMDELGFGLENFDAVGQWREKDGKLPINAAGELPGGARFNGPLELAKVLARRRGEFVRCLAEKMLTYALGRELRVQDRCAVDKIVEQVEAKDYRFAAVVTAIVMSDPFRLAKSDEGESP
jgi:hypothetical protein